MNATDPAPYRRLPAPEFNPEAEAELVQQRLHHFSNCARSGNHPRCSTGERAAFKLAKEVAKLSLLLMDLDGEAREGFLHALQYGACPDTRDIVLRLMPRAS